MNRWQSMVREFHQKVVGEPTSPNRPEIRGGELRARLVLEEAREAAVGLAGGRAAFKFLIEQLARCAEEDLEKEPDLVAAVDGCVDGIYVNLGTLEAVGVDADPLFDEVHRTNMRKVAGTADVGGVPGKKGAKPPGWTPPRIAALLDEARTAFEATRRFDSVVKSFDEAMRRLVVGSPVFGMFGPPSEQAIAVKDPFRAVDLLPADVRAKLSTADRFDVEFDLVLRGDSSVAVERDPWRGTVTSARRVAQPIAREVPWREPSTGPTCGTPGCVVCSLVAPPKPRPVYALPTMNSRRACGVAGCKFCAVSAS